MSEMSLSVASVVFALAALVLAALDSTAAPILISMALVCGVAARLEGDNAHG